MVFRLGHCLPYCISSTRIFVPWLMILFAYAFVWKNEIQKAVWRYFIQYWGSISQIFRHIDIRQIDICIIVSCTITIIILYPLIGVRAYAYTQEIGPMLNNIGSMLNNIGPKKKKHDWKIFLKFFDITAAGLTRRAR